MVATRSNGHDSPTPSSASSSSQRTARSNLPPLPLEPPVSEPQGEQIEGRLASHSKTPKPPATSGITPVMLPIPRRDIRDIRDASVEEIISTNKNSNASNKGPTTGKHTPVLSSFTELANLSVDIPTRSVSPQTLVEPTQRSIPPSNNSRKRDRSYAVDSEYPLSLKRAKSSDDRGQNGTQQSSNITRNEEAPDSTLSRRGKTPKIKAGLASHFSELLDTLAEHETRHDTSEAIHKDYEQNFEALDRELASLKQCIEAKPSGEDVADQLTNALEKQSETSRAMLTNALEKQSETSRAMLKNALEKQSETSRAMLTNALEKQSETSLAMQTKLKDDVQRDIVAIRSEQAEAKRAQSDNATYQNRVNNIERRLFGKDHTYPICSDDQQPLCTQVDTLTSAFKELQNQQENYVKLDSKEWFVNAQKGNKVEVDLREIKSTVETLEASSATSSSLQALEKRMEALECSQESHKELSDQMEARTKALESNSQQLKQQCQKFEKHYTRHVQMEKMQAEMNKNLLENKQTVEQQESKIEKLEKELTRANQSLSALTDSYKDLEDKNKVRKNTKSAEAVVESIQPRLDKMQESHEGLNNVVEEKTKAFTEKSKALEDAVKILKKDIENVHTLVSVRKELNIIAKWRKKDSESADCQAKKIEYEKAAHEAQQAREQAYKSQVDEANRRNLVYCGLAGRHHDDAIAPAPVVQSTSPPPHAPMHSPAYPSRGSPTHPPMGLQQEFPTRPCQQLTMPPPQQMVSQHHR